MKRKHNIFIDGQSGTTGLQIYDRLKNHQYINLLEVAPEDRKNPAVKKQLMESADLTFFCLPDDAAREAAAIAKETNSRIIDASSAHRCSDDWVYGLPELEKGQRERIKNAQLVANPGCYATGALLLLKPLLHAGILDADTAIHVYGLSGYSGGGKSLIETYQTGNNPSGFAMYGLDFNHKHIPEITKWSGLASRPTFFPGVVNTYQGMLVLISLNDSELADKELSVAQTVSAYYAHEEFIRCEKASTPPKGTFTHVEGLEKTNYCDLSIYESEEHGQTLLMAKLDNLGKGASGAAVQNMNIMLGLPESLGVNIDAH